MSRSPAIAPARAAKSGALPQLDETFERHTLAITILLAGHQLRRINKTYEAFHGDLLLATVMGEIGVHNLREAIREVHGGDAAAPALRAFRRPQLAQAGRIPRETVRRAVQRLVETGWLQQAAPGKVALTDQALDFFGSDYNRALLDDLLWTGDRIRELVRSPDDPRERARLRRDLLAALATRKEDHVQPIFSTQFSPPTMVGRDLGQQPLTLALTLAEYWLTHLQRLQEPFAGDLVQALLLGEVGHYNIASLAYRRDVGLATLDAVLADGGEDVRKIMRPCNAHSLSLATRVPDSSVRRKLAALEERGWLAKTPGGYVTTSAPAMYFKPFNAAALRNFLDAEQRLRQLLKPAA